MENLKKLTVLYVEDELETLELYEQYFQNIFGKVYIADNGIEALDKYNQYKPDLLILDIIIPDKTGIEVAKEIRKLDNDVKIIMLTGQDDKATLLQAIELNLVTYLEKPVTRQSMKEALSKLSKQIENRVNEKIVILSTDQFYSWNSDTKTLYKNNIHVKLTSKEQQLFELLISKKNQTCSYEYIYDNVWIDDSYKDFSIPAIKTLIKNLRSKLPKDMIVSSYGNGYFLQIEV